jgi:hypothetical protein
MRRDINQSNEGIKEYVGPESGITEWEEGWTYYITDEQESAKNEETV